MHVKWGRVGSKFDLDLSGSKILALLRVSTRTTRWCSNYHSVILYVQMLFTKNHAYCLQVSCLRPMAISKCVDVIDHAILLTKIRACGIDTSLFSAYHCNNTQSAILADHSSISKISSKLPSNIGVFQGSTLVPLLFSVFAMIWARSRMMGSWSNTRTVPSWWLVAPNLGYIKLSLAELVLTSFDHWFRFTGLTGSLNYWSNLKVTSIPIEDQRSAYTVLTRDPPRS